jgi:hypothetical protein
MEVDVTLLNALNDVVENNKEITESFKEVTSALTEKIDKIATGIPSSKTITSLDTKIGELNTKTSVTDGFLKKMDTKLGDMSELMAATNKLTKTQNKLLQTLDPGSRRLKGDTYDSPVTRDRKFDRQREKLIRRMGGSAFVRNPIKTALGASMLLGPARAIWNHKMLFGALAAAGLIDPNYWKSGSNMGFREGAFGEGSWLRRNFGGRGGMAGAALDWSLDNPGYAAGGAALVGTGLGRSALGLGARGIGLATAAATGGAGRMVSGVRAGVGHTLRNPNVAAGSWRSGGRTVWGATRGVGGIHGLGSTPARTVGEPALRKLVGGVVGRKMKAAGMAAGSSAIRRGLTVAVAKQIAHLAAARVVTGLAAAATGVGTLATIGLWGWAAVDVAGMLWPYIKDWWTEDKWEKEARELKEFKNLAFDTEEQIGEFGKSIKDPKTGLYLSRKELGDPTDILTAAGLGQHRRAELSISETTGQSRRFYATDAEGKAIADTAKQAKARKAYASLYKYRQSIWKDMPGTGGKGSFGARVMARENERKALAKKIVAISDGKQFTPNGTAWNVKRLWENYSYQQLSDLYYRAVLPRASSDPKLNSKAKAAVKARLALGQSPVGAPAWATEKGQEGMGIKGSAAEWTEEQNLRRFAQKKGMTIPEQNEFVKAELAETARIGKEESRPGQVDEFFNASMGFPEQMQLMLQEQAKLPQTVSGEMKLNAAQYNGLINAFGGTPTDDSPPVGKGIGGTDPSTGVDSANAVF